MLLIRIAIALVLVITAFVLSAAANTWTGESYADDKWCRNFLNLLSLGVLAGAALLVMK